MRFLSCFSQYSLYTVSRVLTVPSESTVVFSRFDMFRLQLWCTGRLRPWKRSALVRKPRLIGETEVFCTVPCLETGDRLVLAAEDVEASHSTISLCSVDPSR